MNKEYLITKVDPGFKAEVKKKAEKEDITYSKLIRNLLIQWMNGEIKINNKY